MTQKNPKLIQKTTKNIQKQKNQKNHNLQLNVNNQHLIANDLQLNVNNQHLIAN